MRLARSLLPLALSAALLLTAVPTARAQTSNQDRQRELQAQIQEISAEEAAAQQTLAEVRERKGVIDARVAELDAQLSDASARATAAEADAARANAALEQAQRDLERTQAELDAAKQEVQASAGDLYRSARRGATFDILTIGRPEDLVSGSQYLERVNDRQRETMGKISILRDDLADRREVVADTKDRADAAAAEADRARDEIASVRAEVEPVRAEAQAQADAEAAQLETLAGLRHQAEAELEEVSAAIAAELRALGAASAGAPPPPGGCAARPVNGGTSSGFGPRWGRQHQGIDVPAPTGTPIRACWAGTVQISGWQGGYGNTVVIDHGGGVATLYAHQSSIASSVGQTVEAGQVIGFVGSTGHSTGPHLHFEVRLNGEPVDPAPYL